MHPSRYPACRAAVAALVLAGCAGAPERGAPAGRSDGGNALSAPGGGDADAVTVVPEADAAPADLPPLPWPYEPFPEPPTPADNPTTDDKIALGRLLFYDPIVSSDRETACATCHSELWGMGDALRRSVGVDGGLLSGPGRSGPNVLRRNAQTLWNVAYRTTAFWDGRAASLEDQVRFPFEAEAELGRDLEAVIAEMQGIPEYVRLFAKAFPDDAEPVTSTNLERAVAAFERTLVSSRGLYDSYLAGDPGALSDNMVRGMGLFAEEGCADCHVPPLFSSERYADRGVAALSGVEDAGRFEVTGDEVDRGRFKVPTLRNLHDTGPYFHTGAVDTIAEAVAHEVRFSVEHDGARELDDSELEDLVAFIKSGLFDPTRAPDRPQEVPSGLTVPIDGFSLVR